MRMALIQPDVTIGKIEENVGKIIAATVQAYGAGAQLCLLPNEAVLGPSENCIANVDFAERLKAALKALTVGAKVPVLCQWPGSEGFTLISSGGPSDVGRTLRWGEHTIGDDETADILLCASARPFAPGGQAAEEARLARLAREKWICAPNLCGGYGGTVYNGQSVVIRPGGGLVCRGAAFEEDLLICDLKSGWGSPCYPDPASLEEQQWLALVAGTRDFVHKAGSGSAILGLSGGMDSALVACVATEALGAPNVTGILMPSPYSSSGSVNDALKLARNLGIGTIITPIENILKTFTEALGPVFRAFPARENDLTHENLQARIRGVILMAASNRSGALVLNTGNRSEAEMGYCTLYGDTVGAVAVIGDLYKTRVYELARWYCAQKMVIPAEIFTKAPSAELRPNQKDTDSLPPYDELDAALKALNACSATDIDCAMLRDIQTRVQAARFKRCQCPPRLLVG